MFPYVHCTFSRIKKFTGVFFNVYCNTHQACEIKNYRVGRKSQPIVCNTHKMLKNMSIGRQSNFFPITDLLLLTDFTRQQGQVHINMLSSLIILICTCLWSILTCPGQVLFSLPVFCNTENHPEPKGNFLQLMLVLKWWCTMLPLLTNFMGMYMVSLIKTIDIVK